MDISQLRRTPLFAGEDAIGKELKYSLTAGSPLSLESLQLPKVVQRGDMVQLVAETESLQVRQQAEALEDGEVGKVIDVRNSSSRLVVQAIVVAAGKVKIQL
jgi:flagella basal body P-ring formation protein FlgA